MTNSYPVIHYSQYSRVSYFQNRLIAEPQAHDGLRHTVTVPPEDDSKVGAPRVRSVGRRRFAGERLSGMSVSASGLGLAKGALGKVKQHKSKFWEGGWKEIVKGSKEARPS